MLTDDEIKKAINKAFSLGQTYWEQSDSESYSQNKKADETLERYNNLVAATLASSSAAREDAWIPVSERLPDDGEADVLCYEQDRRLQHVACHDAGGWYTAACRKLPGTITHWRRLSAAPKEDAARSATKGEGAV